MEEKKLVEQILKSDKKAISRFYQTYKHRLLKIILNKVGSAKDAEEILHDTFISSLDSLPLFKFNSSLFTWLLAIARHEIADFYRRRKIKAIVFSRLPFLEKIVDKALGPELALQEKEMKIRIFNTFKGLSEGYCQILRLKYIDKLSVKEIAKKLGASYKAVESKLSRARLAFRKLYVNLDDGHGIKGKRDYQKALQILDSAFDQGELPF